MKTIIVGLVLSVLASLPGPTTTYYRIPDLPAVKVGAVVTAYTSSEDETNSDPFTTASGERTRDGIVACPAKYDFGTKIVIEGIEYVCEDRMNKRYRDGNYFDIWVETKDEAYEWGRRELAIILR